MASSLTKFQHERRGNLRQKTVCKRTLERSHAHHSERRPPANLSADDIPFLLGYTVLSQTPSDASLTIVFLNVGSIFNQLTIAARNQRVHLHVSQPRLPRRALLRPLRLRRELRKPPAGVFNGVLSGVDSPITSLTHRSARPSRR